MARIVPEQCAQPLDYGNAFHLNQKPVFLAYLAFLHVAFSPMSITVGTYSENDPSVIDCRFMNAHQFNKRRSKDFFSWLAVLLAPGLLMIVPLVNIFTLPIWILWITIPAIPLSVLGMHSYEFQEFGAMPKGTVDWGCIVGFYVVAAFFLSGVTDRKKAAKNAS